MRELLRVREKPTGLWQSLRAFAINAIKAMSVLAVTLSAPVLSVTANIEPLSVIFVAHVNPPSPAPRVPSPPLPTPLRVHNLCLLLSGYIRSTVEFLCSGFTDGFPLHYEGDHVSFETTNLKSTLEHPEVVDAKIKNWMPIG